MRNLTSGLDARRDSKVGLQQLAYTIAQACQAASLGRTTLFAAIKNGDLTARKYGSRTIILRDDLARFLENLPDARARYGQSYRRPVEGNNP
jgi:excisionase family DNA binding protein